MQEKIFLVAFISMCSWKVLTKSTNFMPIIFVMWKISKNMFYVHIMLRSVKFYLYFVKIIVQFFYPNVLKQTTHCYLQNDFPRSKQVSFYWTTRLKNVYTHATYSNFTLDTFNRLIQLIHQFIGPSTMYFTILITHLITKRRLSTARLVI